MIGTVARLSIAAFVILFAGCSGSGGGSSPPPTAPNTVATPRLAQGPHVGYIVGFEALSAQQTILANSLRAQSIASGQQIMRVQLDWQGLESQPGVYNIAELMAALDVASASQQSVFLLVSTLDTGALTLPTDLMASDAQTPAAGLSLDGPEIRMRFRAFLDWLIPEIGQYNVWSLSIANEASTMFGSINQAEITNFLIESANYANSIDTDLAITATVVGDFADPDVSQFSDDLMPHFDIAMFNYYCLDSATLLATDASRWANDVTNQIDMAAGRDIFYQELGCPAGYSDLGGAIKPVETIGASPQLQQEFFEFMMNQVVDRDEIRGAYIFQLFDWSPELTQLFVDGLVDPTDPGAALTVERLTEWLMTVGMCRWSDGMCRPAWDTYLDGVSRAASARSAVTN